MKTIKIFCEGINDQLFIADCLEKFYGIKSERIPNKKADMFTISFTNESEIIDINGFANLDNELYIKKMKDNMKNGGNNIVIFDADYKGQINGNKGIDACRQKFRDIQKRLNVSFEYYIWPNNSIDGEIEALLRQLIKYEDVMKCIETHQSCLKNTSIPNKLKIENEIKILLGFYLHTVNQSSKTKERDYKTEFWNLDTTEDIGVPDLAKFKTFLDRYFQNESDS